MPYGGVLFPLDSRAYSVQRRGDTVPGFTARQRGGWPQELQQRQQVLQLQPQQELVQGPQGEPLYLSRRESDTNGRAVIRQGGGAVQGASPGNEHGSGNGQLDYVGNGSRSNGGSQREETAAAGVHEHGAEPHQEQYEPHSQPQRQQQPQQWQQQQQQKQQTAVYHNYLVQSPYDYHLHAAMSYEDEEGVVFLPDADWGLGVPGGGSWQQQQQGVGAQHGTTQYEQGDQRLNGTADGGWRPGASEQFGDFDGEASGRSGRHARFEENTSHGAGVVRGLDFEGFMHQHDACVEEHMQRPAPRRRKPKGKQGDGAAVEGGAQEGGGGAAGGVGRDGDGVEVLAAADGSSRSGSTSGDGSQQQGEGVGEAGEEPHGAAAAAPGAAAGGKQASRGHRPLLFKLLSPQGETYDEGVPVLPAAPGGEGFVSGSLPYSTLPEAAVRQTMLAPPDADMLWRAPVDPAERAAFWSFIAAGGRLLRQPDVPYLYCVRRQDPEEPFELYELPDILYGSPMDEHIWQAWGELADRGLVGPRPRPVQGPSWIWDQELTFDMCRLKGSCGVWYTFEVIVQGEYDHDKDRTRHPAVLWCDGRRRHNARGVADLVQWLADPTLGAVVQHLDNLALLREEPREAEKRLRRARERLRVAEERVREAQAQEQVKVQLRWEAEVERLEEELEGLHKEGLRFSLTPAECYAQLQSCWGAAGLEHVGVGRAQVLERLLFVRRGHAGPSNWVVGKKA